MPECSTDIQSVIVNYLKILNLKSYATSSLLKLRKQYENN